MTGPSKNQRSGSKQKHQPKLCAKGHELTAVWYATRSRRTMRHLCACDGYTPITK